MKKKIVCIILSVISFSTLNAQTVTLPVVKLPEVPKPAVPQYPNQQIGRPQNNIHNAPATITNQRERNDAIMREVQEHEYRREVQRQNDILYLTNYGFGMLSDSEGTASYYSAFDELNSMLEGKTPLSVGRAVFLVENAYYDNAHKYEDFQGAIKSVAELCNMKIEEEKLDGTDNMVKNQMVFRYITDTLKVKDKKTGKNLFHYPIKYDYEDYQSKINWDSHFVTSLMRNGKGQCHSMPLYYLMLMEELGGEAYWSFSPKHSFVKIQDDKGSWYNVELTAKALFSDTHYMNNSYIKVEAIQNKTYLEPLDKKNIVAEMLVQLAKGYFKKYGYDDFYLKCAEAAMQHSDNKLNALRLKADYETDLTLTLAHLMNAPKPDMMKEMSPEAYKHFEHMQALYKQVDDLGYEEVPDDLYARWLDYLNKEKEKSEKLPTIFIRQRKD